MTDQNAETWKQNKMVKCFNDDERLRPISRRRRTSCAGIDRATSTATHLLVLGIIGSLGSAARGARLHLNAVFSFGFQSSVHSRHGTEVASSKDLTHVAGGRHQDGDHREHDEDGRKRAALGAGAGAMPSCDVLWVDDRRLLQG